MNESDLPNLEQKFGLDILGTNSSLQRITENLQENTEISSSVNTLWDRY